MALPKVSRYNFKHIAVKDWCYYMFQAYVAYLTIELKRKPTMTEALALLLKGSFKK